jgi:hypothetical protein
MALATKSNVGSWKAEAIVLAYLDWNLLGTTTTYKEKQVISSIIHVLFIVIIIGTHSFYNKGDGYI